MKLRRRLFSFATVLMLGVCPLLAATVTYTISGTLGPVLSGTDPVGANGKSGTLIATVSTSLIPISHTATSATYRLPAGAVTVVIGTTTYASTGPSFLKYIVPAIGRDRLIMSSQITQAGITGTVTGTVSLRKGSFTSAVLKHPTKFTPSPQAVTAATVAGGPGSQVKYTLSVFGTTVLGLSGTASN